jgi:hypothetical protein
MYEVRCGSEFPPSQPCMSLGGQIAAGTSFSNGGIYLWGRKTGRRLAVYTSSQVFRVAHPEIERSRTISTTRTLGLSTIARNIDGELWRQMSGEETRWKESDVNLMLEEREETEPGGGRGKEEEGTTANRLIVPRIASWWVSMKQSIRRSIAGGWMNEWMNGFLHWWGHSPCRASASYMFEKGKPSGE